jgi:hypothetical protein
MIAVTMTRSIRTLIAVSVLFAGLFTTVRLASAQEEENTAKHGVMLAIAGQTGDSTFDNAWFDLANECTVITVIDNVNDPISPFIYTRLACQMTQYQIDNAPEYLGDVLLSLTPLYTVNLPVIAVN